MNSYLVQVGLLGHVGKFNSADGADYRRGDQVICRTGRGLEVGSVFAISRSSAPAEDGSIVRKMLPQDEMVWERLQRHRAKAWKGCDAKLKELELPISLAEVELLFDAQNLFFYFVGDPGILPDGFLESLADEYDTKVQVRRFLEKMTTGCGPGCGTEEKAGGCGTSGCATCAVAGKCKAN